MLTKNIEVLVYKAAADPVFRETLLRERGVAAGLIGLELTTAERGILAALPAGQLETVIDAVKVPERMRPTFAGYAAVAMLAALGVAVSGCNHVPAPTGSRPDDASSGESMVKESAAEENGASRVKTGHRPDEPAEAETGKITGSVIDVYGNASSNTAVQIMELSLTTTTDDNGHFVFEGIPLGVYTIVAGSAGPGLIASGVTVEAGGEATVDLREKNIVMRCIRSK
jgi:hypothetical protein